MHPRSDRHSDSERTSRSWYRAFAQYVCSVNSAVWKDRIAQIHPVSPEEAFEVRRGHAAVLGCWALGVVASLRKIRSVAVDCDSDLSKSRMGHRVEASRRTLSRREPDVAARDRAIRRFVPSISGRATMSPAAWTISSCGWSLNRASAPFFVASNANGHARSPLRWQRRGQSGSSGQIGAEHLSNLGQSSGVIPIAPGPWGRLSLWVSRVASEVMPPPYVSEPDGFCLRHEPTGPVRP